LRTILSRSLERWKGGVISAATRILKAPPVGVEIGA